MLGFRGGGHTFEETQDFDSCDRQQIEVTDSTRSL